MIQAPRVAQCRNAAVAIAYSIHNKETAAGRTETKFKGKIRTTRPARAGASYVFARASARSIRDLAAGRKRPRKKLVL